jgi:hypothetical protein
MICKISVCPYCPTEIAFDWDGKAVAFNPDSGHPPCDHVVWVDGTLRLWSETGAESSTNFHWNHATVADPHSRALLGDFFLDIELGAIVEFDAEYSCDSPTVANATGLLDGFVVYAVSSELFLVACRAEMERYPSLG